MKGRFIIIKQKHLTLEEIETIEDMLKENINFTEIGKHRTTISKEILIIDKEKMPIITNNYEHLVL